MPPSWLWIKQWDTGGCFWEIQWTIESRRSDAQRHHKVRSQLASWLTNCCALKRFNKIVHFEALKITSSVSIFQSQEKKRDREVNDVNGFFCFWWCHADGYGAWSQHGCHLAKTFEGNRHICHCNHLTNFAILMVSQTGADSKIIQMVPQLVKRSLLCTMQNLQILSL